MFCGVSRGGSLPLCRAKWCPCTCLLCSRLTSCLNVTHCDAGRDAIFVGVHDAVEHAREQVQDWVSGARDLREMSNMRRTFSVPTPHPRHLGRMDSSG